MLDRVISTIAFNQREQNHTEVVLKHDS